MGALVLERRLNPIRVGMAAANIGICSPSDRSATAARRRCHRHPSVFSDHQLPFLTRGAMSMTCRGMLLIGPQSCTFRSTCRLCKVSCAVHLMLPKVLPCASNRLPAALSMSVCCSRVAASGGATHGWRQAGGTDTAQRGRRRREQSTQPAPESSAWPMHLSRVDARQQTLRHAQQQTELDSAAARDSVHSLSISRSRSVSDSGQTSQFHGGNRQQVAKQRSKIGDSSDPVPLRPPAETRAATGPCDPGVRFAPAVGAIPGVQRGSDGPHRPLETRGDVALHQHPAPDAAPAIASLIAQLACALRTARPAGLTSGEAEGALPQDTCCTGNRRPGVRFLTVMPLPSAVEKPSAADLRTRQDAGIISTAHAPSQLPVVAEPDAAAAVMHSADTAAGLRARLSRLPPTQPASELAQGTAEQQQADSSHEAGADQPDTGTRPHVESVLQNDSSATAAADHTERHSPAGPEHAAASTASVAAEDGRGPAAQAGVPMRWAWRVIRDDQT